MALLQKRPWELDLYTQLAAGDPGYIDPATIMLIVDIEAWDEPKRMNIGQLFFAAHLEGGNLSTASVNVSATYGEEFANSNYVLLIIAYKEVTIQGVGVVRQSIPYHSLVQTAAGFDLVLEDNTDAVVRYFAYE